MELLSAGLTIVILGFLYWRMIKRETPERIGAFQALVPLGLGVVSMFIGGAAPSCLPKLSGALRICWRGSQVSAARCCIPSSWPAVRKKRQSC